MNRDRRLRDLSDDHHQALVLARRATRAAAGDGTAAPRVWNEVVHRFHGELAPHFAIEERLLLPAVEQHGGADLAARTRNEHAELRRLVVEDRQDVSTRLHRFGALLRDHVRFEERVLFGFIQERVGDAALDLVADACEDRRPAATSICRTTQS
ncbi:MAG: hemerythrin domain-containing protein [Myxococcales bacterium]|nr:hemerythrin domain-containing protein [Myxococcales bacterium]